MISSLLSKADYSIAKYKILAQLIVNIISLEWNVLGVNWLRRLIVKLIDTFSHTSNSYKLN